MPDTGQFQPAGRRLGLQHFTLPGRRAQAIVFAADEQQRAAKVVQGRQTVWACGGPSELGAGHLTRRGIGHGPHQRPMALALARVVKVRWLGAARYGRRTLALPDTPLAGAAAAGTPTGRPGIAGDQGQPLHPLRRAAQQLQRPQAAQRKAGNRELFW